MLMTTDTRLVSRATEGDRDAFDAIFEASLPSVFAFAARRTASRAAAERLTERILRRSFASLAGYAGDVPFAAWLLAVAKQVEREERTPPARARRAPLAQLAPR